MGLKIMSVGVILLAIGLIGVAGIPPLVTGLFLLIGAIGVLASY